MKKKLSSLLVVLLGSLLLVTTVSAARSRWNRIPTVTLSVSSTTVTLGYPLTLSWTSSNADLVTASASPTQSEWSNAVSALGSKTITPTVTGTIQYKIVASNKWGTANKSISVTVVAPVVIPTSTPPVIPPVAPPVVTTSTPPAPTSSAIQWGAFVGNAANSLSLFETMVGAQADAQAIFLSWTDTIPSGYKTTVAAAGKTLLVYWEPTVDYDTINSGSQDAIITTFAKNLGSYGGKIILALNEEVNCDNTNPWGGTYGNNTAAKAISTFKRIHDIVKPLAPNVLFAYDVNNVSCYSTAASNSLTAYYPGSAYVDIVGVSGFNFGNPWQTWQSAFITNNAIPTLQTLGKPIWILSTASIDGSLKGQWITDMAAGVKKYNIAGWVWFNQNDALIPGSGSTINWSVDSNAASLLAFKAAVL